MTDKRGKATPELPLLHVEDQAAWEAWMKANAASSPGVWLRLARKKSDVHSPTYAEALDVALAYGWIDSQKRSFDGGSSLQRFTPRRAKSIWSKINREKAEALISAGRMTPAGMAAVEAAKADGRWDAAYDAQSSAAVPDDLLRALDRSPAASAFFDSLNRVNRYAILFRIQTATKPETRARRIEKFIDMLERGEKIHP